jgi:peptidoglycan/LPS O-acetylase OafA/YrhL
MRSALEFRPLRYMGVISYGAYLWHHPVEIIVNTPRWGWLWPWSGIVCTVAIATVSFKFLERPFLHLKDRFGSSPARVPGRLARTPRASPPPEY